MDQHVVIFSCVAAFFVYLNTLDADFAYDDSRAIKTNPDVLPSTPLLQIFLHDFWGTPLTHSGSHKSYRPIAVLSFRLNYIFSQFAPFAYHLTNVILHSIATGLFAFLTRILFPDATIVRLTAPLLFAVHPIHCEAVAGIVGRADVGAAIFFLSSLISYLKYCDRRLININNKGRRGEKRWLILSQICAFLSMLTKEYGVTVLCVCAVYHIFVFSKLTLEDSRSIFFKKLRDSRAFEGLGCLCVSLLVFILFRLSIMGIQPPDFAPADNPASDAESALTRFLTYLFLPAFNAWLLLAPVNLSFDWSMEAVPLLTSFFDVRNMASLFFYSLLSYLTYWSIYRRPKLKSKYGKNISVNNNNNNIVNNINSPKIVIMSLALVIIPFIPATNIFFYVGFVVAERILYIPSMGFCLLASYGSQILYNKAKSPKRKKFILGALVALFLIFSLRTWRRNYDWKTEENLYTAGIQTNPPKAYGNLANIWSAQKKYSQAEWAYRKALSYRTNMADVHYNLGILLQEQKRLDEAYSEYKLAIKFRPRMALAYLNMGLVMGMQGRKTEAVEVYRKCADLDVSALKDPRTNEVTKISALFNLGRLYADEGQYEKAIKVYQEAIEKMPAYYSPQSLYNMLGEAYYKSENYIQAEKWYLESLKAKPNHVPAHLTYAKLLAKIDKPEEAEKWFEKAQKIAPNDHAVFQHFGQFLTEMNRNEEAAKKYLKAAEIAPNEYEIIFNAANTLRQAGKNELAEKYYRLAVNLRPNDLTAYSNLGAMLHVNGNLEEAEKSYLRALELKPDDPITQNNLFKLRQISKKNENRR